MLLVIAERNWQGQGCLNESQQRAITEDCLAKDSGKEAVLMKKKVIVVMPADMIVGGDLKGAWYHGSNTMNDIQEVSE